MASIVASNMLRASARAATTRQITTSTRRANVAALPISETVRSVAEAAQHGVTLHATAQGFKAGVVYTLLAGSGAGAAWLIFGDKAADKTVREVELL